MELPVTNYGWGTVVVIVLTAIVWLLQRRFTGQARRDKEYDRLLVEIREAARHHDSNRVRNIRVRMRDIEAKRERDRE